MIDYALWGAGRITSRWSRPSYRGPFVEGTMPWMCFGSRFVSLRQPQGGSAPSIGRAGGDRDGAGSAVGATGPACVCEERVLLEEAPQNG